MVQQIYTLFIFFLQRIWPVHILDWFCEIHFVEFTFCAFFLISLSASCSDSLRLILFPPTMHLCSFPVLMFPRISFTHITLTGFGCFPHTCFKSFLTWLYNIPTHLSVMLLYFIYKTFRGGTLHVHQIKPCYPLHGAFASFREEDVSVCSKSH